MPKDIRESHLFEYLELRSSESKNKVTLDEDRIWTNIVKFIINITDNNVIQNDNIKVFLEKMEECYYKDMKNIEHYGKIALEFFKYCNEISDKNIEIEIEEVEEVER